MTQNYCPCSTWPWRRMAQRFDDLLSPGKRKRESSKSATLLLSLDTPAAIILLHPVKVVSPVCFLVGIDLIEAPSTSQNGNSFLLSRRCKRPRPVTRGVHGVRSHPPTQAQKVRILILNIEVKECSRLNWSFKLISMTFKQNQRMEKAVVYSLGK